MVTPTVVVLGSLNVDFVAYCLADTLPTPGQTVIGTLFEKNYGGKGANQAVQAARLGVRTRMIGKVGPDDFGRDYLNHLELEERVDVKYVATADDVSTGIAQITVSSAGENSIVIIPGANAAVDEEFALSQLVRACNVHQYDHDNTPRGNASAAGSHSNSLASFDEGAVPGSAGSSSTGLTILCLQNEIPIETTFAAMLYASQNNIRCIYNPAPAPTMTRQTLLRKLQDNQVDIIVPNETELAAITGLPTDTDEDVEDAARFLLNECACRAVVVTRGSRGAYLLADGIESEGDISRFIGTDKVTAVDTTGAGDSFIGSLAAHMSNGASINEAVTAAIFIASQSVLEQGAQASYSGIRELDEQYWPTFRGAREEYA